MNTLTKVILGAALLAGSVVAASAPASAQPAYRGDGVYGREYDGRYGNNYDNRYDDTYDNRYGNNYDNRYDDRYGERYYRGGGMWRSTRMCTSPRFGRFRFDPVMQRRVFVPYRWAVRSGYLRNCMYTMNRGGPGTWYR